MFDRKSNGVPTMSSAKNIFNSHVKSKNIMTPEIIRYGFVGNYAYELSSGGNLGGVMYAVAFAHIESGYDADLSRRFNELSEAEAYIDNFGGEA